MVQNNHQASQGFDGIQQKPTASITGGRQGGHRLRGVQGKNRWAWMRHQRIMPLSSQSQTRARRHVLAAHFGDQFGRADHGIDGTDTLTAAPDVFPSLFGIATEIHFGGV